MWNFSAADRTIASINELSGGFLHEVCESQVIQKYPENVTIRAKVNHIWGKKWSVYQEIHGNVQLDPSIDISIETSHFCQGTITNLTGFDWFLLVPAFFFRHLFSSTGLFSMPVKAGKSQPKPAEANTHFYSPDFRLRMSIVPILGKIFFCEGKIQFECVSEIPGNVAFIIIIKYYIDVYIFLRILSTTSCILCMWINHQSFISFKNVNHFYQIISCSSESFFIFIILFFRISKWGWIKKLTHVIRKYALRTYDIRISDFGKMVEKVENVRNMYIMIRWVSILYHFDSETAPIKNIFSVYWKPNTFSHILIRIILQISS